MNQQNNSVLNVKIIIEFMQKHSLSKSAFCKLCNISISTLNHVLNDDILHLGIDCVFKIAKGMKIQIQDIFCE